MSDYLRNLVNRVHPPQDTVRPRLAARFEPVSGMGDTLDPAGGPTAAYPTGVDEGDPQRSILTPEAPAVQANVDDASRRDTPVATASGAQRWPAVEPMLEPESPAPSRHTKVQPATSTAIPQEARSSTEAHFQRIRRTVSPQAPSLPAPLATELASPAVAPAKESALPPPQQQVHSARLAQAWFALQPLDRGEERTMATPATGDRGAASPTATSATTPFQPRPVTRLSLADPLSTPGKQPVDPSSRSAPSAVVGGAGEQIPEPIPLPVRAATPITPRLPEPPPPMETRLVNRQSGPPMIRVTIGRIEVRATSPQPERNRRHSAPAARPPLPQPALSLDAYLKQRGGSQ